MVRTVLQNYGMWLAGYYDDFTGARAIPDDENLPHATISYSHGNSHYGNPMNGEATLNPRYRWAFVDRDRSIGSKFISTTDNKRLNNAGVYEWATYDDIRQNANKWEGRAQLQYPDGHIPNRSKFAANGTAGTEGYQLISNGYDSSTRYIVATGDNDSTFGRVSMKNYTEANFEDAGGYSLSGQMTSSTGNFVQRAHLAGVWTGETIKNNSGALDDTAPYDIFHPLTSPAKTPFLCIQSFHRQHDSAGNHIAICYDGTLNSKLNEDIFTIRLAVRNLVPAVGASGTNIPRVTLELGSAAPASNNLDNGLATIVVSYNVDLSNYATSPVIYDNSTSKVSISNDDQWLDIDIVLDYENNQYKVYQEGVLKQTTGSFTITPEQLYGWQITTLPLASYTNPSNITVMVDRVALMHPLTDHPDTRELAPLSSLQLTQPINGYSQLTFKIADDRTDADGTAITDYSHQIKNIFMSSSLNDWHVLFFGCDLGAERIDRPLWQGLIKEVNIKQSGIGGRVIDILATDRLVGLSKQIPMWEVGQGSLNDSEDITPYWLADAKGFNQAMYMGVRELKECQPTVGFDVDDAYVERTDQRTQLGSGHPIQMYNDENPFGPNSIWDAYDGMSVIGIGEEYSTGLKTVMMLKGDPGWSSGAVTIENSTSHNATATPTSSADVGSNQKLYFNPAHIAHVPSPGKIMYIGKYKPTALDYDFVDSQEQGIKNFINSENPQTPHNETDVYHMIFDDNPLLIVGDSFFIGKLSKPGATSNLSTNFVDVVHTVKTIQKSWNYFNQTTTDNEIWIVETDTEYGSGGSEFGTYTSDALKVSGDRLEWSGDTGQIPDLSEYAHVESRAIHARWLQDLPQSLWFQYHFGQIGSTPLGFADLASTVSDTTIVHISDDGDNTAYTEASTSGGIAQLYHPNYGYTPFIYRGTFAAGDNRYLIGCEYLGIYYPKTDSVKGVTIESKVYILDISNDYKHLWLLWSDMRNNASADADGAYRKTNFGLLYPTNTNYEINLHYVDQLNTDGTPDHFIALKSKDDYNIWNIDATVDPSTGGAFSKPADFANAVVSGITLSENSGDTKLRVTKSSHGLSTGDYIYLYNSILHNGHYEIEDGSNSDYLIMAAGTWNGTDLGKTGAVRYAPINGSHIDLLKYRDWEDKGGAFVVIDTSPFFNLNTRTNGGKSGQTSGDRTSLGDYDVTVNGFPMLIDNYYAEAMSSYKTTGTGYEEHPNSRRLVVEATLVTKNMLQGENYIVAEDLSGFPSSGLGRMVAEKGTGRNREILERFISWGSKTSTSIAKTTSSATPTAYYGTYDLNIGGGSYVTGEALKVSGENFVTLGVQPGAFLYKPLSDTIAIRYVVSGITTTSSTNDTLLVHRILDIEDMPYQPPEGLFDILTTSNIPYGVPIGAGLNDLDDCYADISSEWANGGGDDFIIPAQLNGVWTCSVNSLISSTTESPNAVEQELSSLLANLPYSDRRIDSTFSIEGDEPDFDKITLNSSVSSQYMLRLLMKMDGYTVSPNVGTYYESDKFRFLWNSSLVRNWLPPTQLYNVFDINNIPITSNITTDGTVSNTDSYGGSLDARGKNFEQIVRNIKDSSGIGTTYTTTFCFLQGKDGRFEFRPKYNSGLSLTRSNINISNMKMDIQGQIDRVRLHYDEGLSFVDWPETASPFTSTSKWKVIEEPKIKQHDEAVGMAKSEYEKLKTPALSLEVTPILDSADYEPMLTDGRYGYIADPQIALMGLDDCDTDSSDVDVGRHRAWTLIGTGGVPFSGMVNALDGNQKTSTDIYHRYGQSKVVSGNNVSWDDNFYWYGAKSVSYAVQVVHVPKRCPLDSDTTSEELRVWVALKDQTGTSIDDAEFIIGLCDYAYSTATGDGGDGPRLTATLATNGIQTVTAKHSGFYEITVPESYSSSMNSDGAKFVISFNAEYCKALLRHRCGLHTQTAHASANYILDNAHDVTGFTSFSSYNDKSIFPLGLREFSEMGGCSFAADRSEYHGPRLHIMPDFAYTPATFVTLTDAGLNLSSEVLVINNIAYNITPDRISVALSLEKDESKSTDSVTAYLFPTPPSPPTPATEGLITFSTMGGPINEETDSNNTNNMPTGGEQSYNQASNDFRNLSTQNSSGDNYNASQNFNLLSSGAYSGMKGRMDLASDSFSHQSQFSILGQKKPSSVPAIMRGASDNNTLKVTHGAATKNDDGFTLPPTGSHPSDEAAIFHKADMQTMVTVPSDAISEEIALSALVTCGDGTTAGKAVLNITLECVDTGAKLYRTVHVPTNTFRKNIDLIPSNNLSGANTPSNRIKVTISRRNVAEDTATSTSVVLHSVDLQFKRAGMQGRSQVNQFRPYQ